VVDEAASVRPRRQPAAFAEADAKLAEVLAELEGAVNYKRWLLAVVGPHLRGRIVEIGAGRGTYSLELRGLGTSLTSIEPSTEAAQHLHARLDGRAHTEIVVGTTEQLRGRTFDSAVMLNVLEHIEDDTGALQVIHDSLVDGGSLAVWVPAFPMLYGRFDKQVGHHRRYTVRSLQRVLEAAGFEVSECRYINFPGFFAWFLVVRLLGARPTASRLSRFFDRWVVPVTERVERRVRFPAGQSAVAIARRPARDT
jgi:SAM-dependent methyltransferase